MTRSLVVPVVLALCLAGGSASAFVRTSSLHPSAGEVCAWWPERDLDYVVNARGSADTAFPALLDAVQRSSATWTDVACSDLTLTYAGETDRVDASFLEQPTAEKPNINLLVWREKSCDLVVPAEDPCRGPDRKDCADVYDCWNGSDSTIALTFVNYSKIMGFVADADIEFNGAPTTAGEWRFTATVAEGPKCATPEQPACVSTDVQNTTTHEFGHFIGFGHSSVVEATMFASADLGETSKRTLAADDQQAICSVYPAGGATLLCTRSGTFDFAEVSHDTGCTSFAPAPWLLAVLFVVRRRRGERLF